MGKRLCTICARGGSKGVKNKNVRTLLGMPLIAHTIIQAKESNMFDTIAVSSDDQEILNISQEYGVDLIIERTHELATDQAAKLPVIQDAALRAENILDIQYETYVDLDATSPLRSISDIQNAIKLYENSNPASNLITGAPSRRSPYFNLVELNKNGYVNLSKKLEKEIVRRQDAPRCFDMNASIYIWNRENLFNSKSIFNDHTIIFEMPEERSIDIDSELDFEIVEFLAKKRGRLV